MRGIAWILPPPLFFPIRSVGSLLFRGGFKTTPEAGKPQIRFKGNAAIGPQMGF